MPGDDGRSGRSSKYISLGLTQYLTESLRLRGYQYFLEYNAIDGFAALPPRGETAEPDQRFLSEAFKLNFDSAGRYKCSLSKAFDVLDGVLAHKEHFVAVVFDFASRYSKRVDRPRYRPSMSSSPGL